MISGTTLRSSTGTTMVPIVNSVSSRSFSTGGKVHYVVGNSTFYDVIVPVERLFADMLTKAGFREARITRIRKRNSKKELYEFDVSATK